MVAKDRQRTGLQPEAGSETHISGQLISSAGDVKSEELHQIDTTDKGGTMRLGVYPCVLEPGG